MKALLLTALLAISPFALAEEWDTPEIAPADSRCLADAVGLIEAEMDRLKKTVGFAAVLDKSGLPMTIHNFETGESFEFDGVWSTNNDEEFIQYVNTNEVFTALMVYSATGPGCEAIHLGNAELE